MNLSARKNLCGTAMAARVPTVLKSRTTSTNYAYSFLYSRLSVVCVAPVVPLLQVPLKDSGQSIPSTFCTFIKVQAFLHK